MSPKVVELRQLLAERFGTPSFAGPPAYSSGFQPLDVAGVSAGALTEVIAEGGMCLFLYGLLNAVLGQGDRVILIDGKDSFSPGGVAQPERLLWLRCRHAGEAVKAADLAVRDGNIPLVVLFLALNPADEFRRIPSTVWHRLQMVAEKSAVALVACTARPQIGCARLRLSAVAQVPFAHFHRTQADLLPSLQLRVERRRIERTNDEDLCRVACA